MSPVKKFELTSPKVRKESTLAKLMANSLFSSSPCPHAVLKKVVPWVDVLGGAVSKYLFYKLHKYLMIESDFVERT